MNNSLSQPNFDSTATTSVSDDVYLFPVSFAQQRLWFLDQLEGPSATYTDASARSLQGALHIPALEQTIQTLVQRHETLRTTFRVIDNAPMQIIRPSLTLSIPRIDLTQLSSEEQSFQVQALIQEFAQHTFDLQTGPLIRISLVQLSAQKYILLLAMHHIITDGWSMQVFWQEFSALYQAFSKGQPSPLPELSIQYADYTLWQQEWLQGEVSANQLTYWKQQLSGELPILQLPIDRPRPLVQTYKGSHQTITLSSEVAQALKALSQAAHTTLFMTLLAAFQTLLHRYSGQTDIIVGTPIAGRNPVETEPLIGFFANTLALRTDLTSNPTFRQLLQRVREVALGAYSHADIPFEKLVEELRPQRDPSHSPLFQVMFSLRNFTSSGIDLPGLAVETIPMSQKTAKFDLSLALQETAEGLRTRLEYNTDLFDDATITRMLGHWRMLLDGIVSNPDQPIGQLPLLTEAERNQILVEWNDTASDYPQDQCIHQLFEEQVECRPDAIAVIFEDGQLTYRELNARANQLAYYLQGLGVGPDVLVGICLERSLEMVVTLLGVLKAGGAYVPLDPDYPQERLNFMLKDAQPLVLLTKQHLINKLSASHASLVCLDADWQLISQSSQDNLDINVQPWNLAYVIYTSGSTGQPKGVAMNRLALCNLLWWQLQNMKVHNHAKTLQFAPISFDVSFQEIFSTWCSGGTLLLVTDGQRRNPVALLRLLQDKAITRLFLPFVVLQQLAETDLNHSLEDSLNLEQLQEILTAGEQLQITPAIANWFSKLTSCTLQNQYGPTESHVVTAFTLSDSVDLWTSLPPIGRPISNTQIYILDKYLQPVPIGVTGEIYIGGVGIARDYLNQPKLTAEKFIKNPFGSDRLYKTGDLGRYLADSNIEFLGRIDHQVKIRGFRIEVGEIEAVLVQHPQVEEVVVVAREGQPSGKHLIAYIVPDQRQFPSSEELRQFLKQRLPNYMMPSAFVPLEAIPLTPSGKVDRCALPDPDWQQQTSATFLAPRNATEQQLAEIWRTVLWREQPVGIHDNFFDIGGHSLLAVRLVAEIEKAFGTKLPLSSLFQLGTIAELAEILNAQVYQIEASVIRDVESKNIQETKDNVQQVLRLDPEIHRQLIVLTSAWKGERIGPDSLVVGLNTQGTRPPLFWCFQGFRELSQMAKYIGEDQPVYGMRSGHLIMQYTEENVQALANHYVREILRIQPEGSYRLGGNCQAGKIMFTIAQQLQQQGKSVALLCLLEAFIPKPYFSPVAFFFGQESDRFNPYKSFSEPELGYRKYYRGGFSITIVSGGHGQYFSEPNVQVFAREVRQALDKANVSERAILTSSAYQAHISSGSSLTFVSGETYSLTVTVKNMSPVTWLATEQSGIFLANHWLDEKGDVICWLDGRAAIDRDLAPNESIQLEITVTAPTELGQYQLELDLVEEGITWFKDKGSESSIVQVEISELNEIQGDALQKFRYLQQDGNLEQKIVAKSVMTIDPPVVEDVQRRQIGDDRFMKGDFAGAIAHYEKAIQLNPAQPAELYLNLGKALSQTGKVPEAIAYYEKAIQLAPDFAHAYEQLGTIQKQQGDLEGAIANYQTALQLDPQLNWIYAILAATFAQNGQQNLAIAAYETAIKHQRMKPELYFQLGHLLLKQGELDAAIANFQQAIGLNIEGEGIYICLGNAFSQKQLFEEAATAYSQAIALKPNSPYSYGLLANVQRQQGALQDAVKNYLKAIEYNHPNLAWHYKKLGDCFHQLEKIEEAIAAYEQSCLLKSDNAGFYRLLGNLQFQVGAFEKTIESYQKAIELEPNQPLVIYRRLGDLLYDSGKIEAAILVYQAILNLYPQNRRFVTNYVV